MNFHGFKESIASVVLHVQAPLRHLLAEKTPARDVIIGL